MTRRSAASACPYPPAPVHAMCGCPSPTGGHRVRLSPLQADRWRWCCSCTLSWRIIIPHAWSPNPILQGACGGKPWACLPQPVHASASETQQTCQVSRHRTTLASTRVVSRFGKDGIEGAVCSDTEDIITPCRQNRRLQKSRILASITEAVKTTACTCHKSGPKLSALFYVERSSGHMRAIQSAHSRRSASSSKCRPINTKADAAGGSPASCRTSSHWYTP